MHSEWVGITGITGWVSPEYASSIRDVFYKSEIVIGGVFLAIVGRKSIFWGFYDGAQMHEIDVVEV
ncbi:hypothetical protein D0T84_07425 [Dysgonomonas sp. 521]|uniref:hypothetical protein n=1 Tax=Dysgonomonas sp. 521 TaxID=2302932 RepID=UPI0013D0C39E|nr:hypothetical protein [Dysgonomonas sp. 521]NDV94749.1 hypothetical protein [Dysgonomonas sp. 521]